jgi:phosphate transport system permease protein
MTTSTASPRNAKPGGLDPMHDESVRRRHRTDRGMTLLLALIMALVVAVLVWVIGYVAVQGLKFLGPEFLTQTPPGDPSQFGGGFLNGILGSLIIVGIATVIAVPTGVAAAVYIHEYGGRMARSASFLTDVLVGIPTIVTGAFVYSVVVVAFGFSGYAGGLALGLIMLPLVVRATAEMLRLVPNELKEASLALGVSKSRTIWSVVLPTASAGIITGAMLAVARAMGETAPLLLTALGNDLFVETNPGHRMSTLSLQIFGNAITGFKAAIDRAWAGALTLVGLVLLFTVVARLIARRNPIARRSS